MDRRRLIDAALLAFALAVAVGIAWLLAPWWMPAAKPGACAQVAGAISAAQDEGNDSLTESLGAVYEEECQ